MFERGSRIGKYTVERELGTGGMGTVLLVRDDDQREYAVKVARADAQASVRQRFLQEVKVTKRLQDMHLVNALESNTYDAGNGVQAPYLVLEFLVGQTLEEALDDLAQRGESMALHDLVRIAREVAAGLAAAHAKSIIHRDLKPSNIFICRSDVTSLAKIIDFGLALIQRETVVESSAPILSPPYAPPEQWTHWERADAAADIYSFGATLYEALAGSPPFGVGGELEALHRDAPVPSLAKTRAAKMTGQAVPAALAALVEKMLAKAPADRPKLAEVASALAQIERRLGPTPIGGGGDGRKVLPWVLVGGGSVALAAIVAVAMHGHGAPASIDGGGGGGQIGGDHTVTHAPPIDGPPAETLPPEPAVPGAVYIAAAPPGTHLGVAKPANLPDDASVDVRWSSSFTAPNYGYWISAYPVTYADARMDPPPGDSAELPAQGLPWISARDLCATIVAGRAGDLPTEAEWEWAARSGDRAQPIAQSVYAKVNDELWRRTQPPKLLPKAAQQDIVHAKFGDLFALFTGVEEWTRNAWVDENGKSQNFPGAFVTRGFPPAVDIDPAQYFVAASGPAHRARLLPDLPVKTRKSRVGFRCVWK